ncbi:hypothetical protein SLEP1_g36275 [Rubroshorea leprosula]|uniref:Uncharacterized protein n=1 Tax=Rubroshorea leprosula TaxID=152421 RepID=A0AAV5KR09_9ROSI|nr:hypothetical protein SLEP1_g36275 [Rubroshorea leprosula]
MRERMGASRGHRESLVRRTSQRSVFGRQTDQVQRRRGDGNIRQEGCRQSFGGYDWKIYNQATAFFFTNFPEEWNYEDLWRLFSKYGRIYSIYSPERRDRFGRRFGFVRFLEVKDKKELERQLDQIWIGHTKLRANIPRFKEEDRNGKKKANQKLGCKTILIVARGNTRPMAEHRGNSRTKHSEKPNRRKWQKKNNDQEWTGFEFNVKEEDYSWLQGCYGKFITLDESTSKKKRFDIARFLICTPVMDSISKKLKVKINGTVYNIRVVEEEFSNSLFSIKLDFIPDFPSDSEIESNETWEIDSVEDEASKGVDTEVEKLFSDMEIRVPREEEEDVALVEDSLAAHHNSKIAAPLQTIGEQDMDARYGLVGETLRPNTEETTESVNGPTQGKDMEKVLVNTGGDNQNAKNAFPVRCNQFTSQKASDDMEGPNRKPTISEGLEVRRKKSKNRTKKRARSCIAVYKVASAILQKRNRGEKCKGTQQLKENLPTFLPNPKKVVAGESVGDSDIINRNKEIRKGWKKYGAEEIWEFAKLIGVLGQRRSISDHCPIILKNISVDWGPRPFKWFDAWLDTPGLRDEIKKTLRQKIVEHYTCYFKDEEWRRPTLDGINFNRLSPNSAAMLVDNFTEEEVKKVVWDCGVTKAPGLDGFNFRFIREMWEVLKEDIMGIIQEFHENGKLVRGLNESFIVLIPKKENPLELEDFRPISLIGAIYKILTKILSNRLSQVMQEIIGEQQIAFVKGRQLIDGVVVANEVIDEVHRKRKSSFVFKIDFEKAFDKVSWKFLDYMLERMGFDSEWRGWIQECLSTNRVSILVNGNSTDQFSVSQGLRQGDPLSSFLFLIIAEGLNGIIASTISKKLFAGVSVVFRGPYWGQPKKIENLATAGGKFQEEVVTMEGEIRIYGRLNYSDQCCVVKPTSIFDEYVSHSKRGWENVCKSKEEGGLGVNLRTFNLALMGKWWGRFAKGKGGLWHKVLKAKYGREGVNWTRWMKESSELGSLWWRDVCRLNEIGGSNIGWLERGFELDVGEGKENVISQMGKWKNGEWTWDLKWRHAFREEEAIQLQNVISRLNTKSLTKGRRDVWHWKHDQNDIYSASSDVVVGGVWKLFLLNPVRRLLFNMKAGSKIKGQGRDGRTRCAILPLKKLQKRTETRHGHFEVEVIYIGNGEKR